MRTLLTLLISVGMVLVPAAQLEARNHRQHPKNLKRVRRAKKRARFFKRTVTENSKSQDRGGI